MHIDRIARDHLDRQHSGRVVPCVLASPERIGDDGRAQGVAVQQIGAPHGIIDDLLQGAMPVQMCLNSNRDMHICDPGILTERPVPGRRHARVHQDLGNGTLGRRTLLRLPCLRHRLHEVARVIVGDELQRIRDAVDQMVFGNHLHGRIIPVV